MRFPVRYTTPRRFKDTLLFFGDGSVLLTDTGLLFEGRLARTDLPFARRTELGASGETTVRTIPYTLITGVRPLAPRGGFEITYRTPRGSPCEVLFQVGSGSEEFYQALDSNRAATGHPGSPAASPRTMPGGRAALVLITLVFVVGLIWLAAYGPSDAFGDVLIPILVLVVALLFALLFLFVAGSAIAAGAAAQMGYSGVLFFLLSVLTSPYAGVFVLAGLPDRRIEARRRGVLQWLRQRHAGVATQALAVALAERSLGDMSTRPEPGAVQPVPAGRAPAPELSFPEPAPSRAILGAGIASLLLPVLVVALVNLVAGRAREARSQEAMRVIAGWQEKAGDERDYDRKFALHQAIWHLSKEDTIALARSSTTSPSMLRQIAENTFHHDEATLVLALCKNPRAQGETCAEALDGFFRSERAPQGDLDEVLRYVRGSNVPAEALERLADRAGFKFGSKPEWQDGLAGALCGRRDLPAADRKRARCTAASP